MDIRVRDHMQVLSHKSHNEPSLGPISLVLSKNKKGKKIGYKHASTHTFLWEKKILFFIFNLMNAKQLKIKNACKVNGIQLVNHNLNCKSNKLLKLSFSFKSHHYNSNQ